MAALLSGYAETGLITAKFVRYRRSDGYVWSTAGTPAFVVYSAGAIADFGIAATEVGATGKYTATDPDETTEGDYVLVKAAGASLAVSDLTGGLRWQDSACSKLSSDGLNNVVPTEPAAVPSWGTSTIVQWLSWLGAWSRNKVTSTATTQTLRNDADNANIATITQSDDATTFTSGEAS